MRKLTPIAIAALALAVQAGMTDAQTRERPERPRQQQDVRENPRGERPRPAMPLMRIFDTNANGVIDEEEIAKAGKSLAALDAEGDGNITPEELRAGHRFDRAPRGESRANREGRKARGPRPEADRERPARNRPQEGRPGGNPPERGMRPPLLDALDANKDSTIDASEISGASESLQKLDTNGDGRLTLDELRPQGAGHTRQRPEPGKRSAPAPGERPVPPNRPAQP